MTPRQRRNLDRLLQPRHVAVIGGRDAETVIGESVRAGFNGAIWPVNPKRKTIGGYRCFAAVEELPQAPDAAFIGIPADAVIDVVARLNAMAAGGVVCYSAGFGETGDIGQQKQRALVAAAGDMALVGPNCYGMVNYLDSVALWPFSHRGYCPGYGVAVITQSGMMSSDIMMSQRSLPLTHMISVGNQAGVRIEDFIDVLCEKPEVRAIGVHIEGVREVRGFIEAAHKALKHNTPVVVLKTGTSNIGANLTVSHTGLLSGADDLYQALFDRLGIIRVGHLAQLLETLKFMAVTGLPEGGRLIGFTCSGGGAALLADYAENIGLDLPPITGRVKKQLLPLLPTIATVSNPLDYTTPIWGIAEKTEPVFRCAIDNNHDAAMLIQDFPHPESDREKPYYLNDTKAFVAAVKAARIPAMVCSTLPENIDTGTREMLVANRVAPMQGLPEALNAVQSAMRYRRRREQILASKTPHPAAAIDTAGRTMTVVDEWQGKQLLKNGGIPVVEGRKVVRAEAKAAADQLGYPLALKMTGPGIAHKTEIGAVTLNLQSSAAVLTAMARMQAEVARHRPDAVTDQFLLEKMIAPPLAELMVSIRHDRQFGRVMVLASGGIFVELLSDAVTVLLPAGDAELRAALEKLKIAPLVSGFRGGKAADKDQIVGTLQRLIAYVEQQRPGIAEVEINPLFILEDRLCVIDVLLHLWRQ